jgi:hypothetical protein
LTSAAISSQPTKLVSGIQTIRSTVNHEGTRKTTKNTNLVLSKPVSWPSCFFVPS